MAGTFQKATRKRARLRMAFDGPSGSGKSMTALRCAFCLGAKVAAIDTERGSLSLYQGLVHDGHTFDFDVKELDTFSPTEYTAAIEEAGRLGYDVLIIDSLSHAWEGKDGALEIKDRSEEKNKWSAWKDVTPMHRRMVDAILTSPCHVIVTMRSRTEWVVEQVEDAHGRKKNVPRKVGLQPIQRPGMEYEFTVYGSLDTAHILTVSKSRCPAVDGLIVSKPGADFMRPVMEWLETGVVSLPPAVARIIPDEQIARLEGLAAKLGYHAERIEAGLVERFGVNKLKLLTAAQADEIEEKWTKAWVKKEIAADPLPAAGAGGATPEAPKTAATDAPASEPPAAELPAAAPPNVGPPPESGVPADQLARLEDLRVRLGYEPDAVSAGLEKHYGVKALFLLTEDQATALEAKWLKAAAKKEKASNGSTPGAGAPTQQTT